MDRAQGLSVRLELTLSYAGFLLLAVGYFSLSRGVHPGVIFMVRSHAAATGSLAHRIRLDLMEALLPLAERRGPTIETSGDASPTTGSPALLLQLSTNLVHHAIVHDLPDRGTVWVTTSAHAQDVELTVENTGEKLTPHFVATLAEPFQRGSKRTRTDHAGVGLGLAIAERITEAHDGSLTLTPRAAGGPCVSVRLPVAPLSRDCG